MEFVRGEDRGQTLLLPDRVEDYISEGNTVRVIDAYINSLDLTELGFSKAELQETGRPPYDRKDLLKLYVYGYMNRIRSSRRLETESKRNMEVIWLLGKLSPDHKTIARFRHDNGKALKNVFRDFVKLCVRLGLYGKELAAIDGSKFKAANSKDRNFNDKKLHERMERIEAHIKEYLEELERIDGEENAAGTEKTAAEIGSIIKGLREWKEKYQGYAQELEQTGERQKSLTDPDSRMMQMNGKIEVCYNIQAAVDAKNKLIVNFEISNQGNDKNFITPMALGSKEILGVDKIAVVTDAGYESIQDITSAMGQGVDVHVAGTDFDICLPSANGDNAEIHSHHNGRCTYIPDRNISLCPAGKVLYPAFHKKKEGGKAVFYNREACAGCTCKCTKDTSGYFRHQISMSADDFSKEYNDKDLAVKQVRIKPDKAIVKQRKSIVEHPFGAIKRAMDCGYCLTKGLRNVTGEFSLAFLAYNIKRAVNIMGVRELILNIT